MTPIRPPKIKAEIEKDNPGVKDLDVRFNEGKVELAGSGSAEALQKAILIAGNTMGVAEVKSAGSPSAAVDDGTQYYVKAGDALSAIAQQLYGDANKYSRIFEANREVIEDANLIFCPPEDPNTKGIKLPATKLVVGHCSLQPVKFPVPSVGTEWVRR
jgi:LysM repeat protein